MFSFDEGLGFMLCNADSFACFLPDLGAATVSTLAGNKLSPISIRKLIVFCMRAGPLLHLSFKLRLCA